MTDIICSNGFFLSENNECQICENSCQNYDINNCNCTSCQNGYLFNIENQRCEKCETICQIYEENECNCKSCPNNYELIENNCVEKNETLEDFYFYGYYYGTNESILILKTNNLTNIDDILLELIREKINNGTINTSLIDSGNYFLMESKNTKFLGFYHKIIICSYSIII